MTANPAKTPAGLGKHGRALWRSVALDVAGAGLEMDARELRYLRDAARNADDLARLEAAMADADLVVQGSTGQPVVNPMLAESRQLRSQIAALLARIQVDEPDAKAGSSSSRGSTSARAAAMTRIYGNPAGRVG